MRRCSSVGLGLAVEMIPICTCDSDQAPDLYLHEFNISTEENEEKEQINGKGTKSESGGNNADNGQLEVSSSEACKTRITDLVLELVDAGII